MKSNIEKGEKFRALHSRDKAFIIPNPWDVGSARILEKLGFEALATTSAGFAFSTGKQDGAVSRDEMIEHVRELAASTDLPISADLENGYGDEPRDAAETIRLAAEAGCSGGSIEDMYGRNGERLIYDYTLAAERVRAAAETAHSLDLTFTLTARCENYLAGNPDIGDTIKRLQAYQEAGADVLYAPGLKSIEDITAVVTSVDRPVNVVMGLSGVQLSVSELAAIGVKRISVGSALSRAALGAFIRAATEMRDHGTFTYANDAVSVKDLMEILGS
ncbi:MAG: isocitrate lyase/phosphoenolpyruvate mutase family protein [Acidobacteriota bacterium]